MNTRRIILLLCTPALLFCPAPQQPVFSDPINLFKTRNLMDALNVREQLKTQFSSTEGMSEWIDTWCDYLATIITTPAFFKATGRQVPDIGHDETRLAAYAATTRTPNKIVATFSATETLQEAVASLTKNRVAHNFIIDTDGSIHQIKREGESDEQALMHRPFALGVSGIVEDGYYENHDLNASSISISVIGKDTSPATPQQTQAMIDLVAHLSNQFSIKPTDVLDYGCIALQHNPEKPLYGRRNTQPLLPWQELAEHNLAVWPRAQDSMNVDVSSINPEDLTIWTSTALRKIGFLCPPTHNCQHPGLTNALQTFQKHFQCDNQTGAITDQTVRDLNSVLIQYEQWNEKLRDICPPPLPQKNETFR